MFYLFIVNKRKFISTTNTSAEISVHRRYNLPLHLNFEWRMCPIFLRRMRRGLSQRAPLVSIGWLCRYSASHC